MSDKNEIVPSDVLKIKVTPEEINCAATISSAIHEGFKKAGLKDGESLVSKLALADSLCDILISHTRADGRTAEYWKMAFDQASSSDGEYIGLIGLFMAYLAKLQSSLTEAQRIAEDARREWAKAEESLRLANRKFQAIVDEDPFDSCRATRIAKAYLASRQSTHNPAQGMKEKP